MKGFEAAARSLRALRRRRIVAWFVMSRQAQRIHVDHLQRAFGALLVVFSIWFVVYRLFIK